MSGLNIIFYILSFIIGLFYIDSSLTKLRNIYAFRNVLRGYQLNNEYILLAIAFLLPPLELFIGINLLISNHTGLFGILGAGLQVLFIAFMLKKYGLNLPYGCGCFGIYAPSKVTYKHILINIGFLFAFLLISFNSYYSHL